MSGNRGIAAVIGAAVVLGAGFAAAYLLWWQPRVDESQARSEVEELSSKWQSVRACVYGPRPASGDPFEAAIARELAELEERGRCDGPLKIARRAEGFTSGDPALEERWRQMDRARIELAKSLALRAAERPLAPPENLRHRVAEAARAAEEAHDELRGAAGLAPDPLAADPLPRIEGKPLGTGPAEYVSVSNNQVMVIAADGGVRVVTVAGADGLETIRVPEGATLATGHQRWVAWTEKDGDEGETRLLAGDLEGDQVPAPVEVARFEPGSQVRVFAALGDERGGRAVVAQRFPGWTPLLFRSRDRGASFAPEPLPFSGETDFEARPPGSELFPIEGRLILDHDQQTLELSGADLSRVGSYDFVGMPCFAPRTSWWLTDRGLRAGAPGEPLAPVPGSEELPWLVRACSDRQVLGVGPGLDGQRVRLCTAAGCTLSALLPPSPGTRFAAVIGPMIGPAVAFESDGILVVWTVAEDGEGLRARVAGRLAEGATLGGLLDWKGQLTALIHEGNSVSIGRLPRDTP
jgi:hypothetical protein